MLSLDGATKQEVNQSPLAFVETPIQANVEQALARKDAIIRVRNAQVPCVTCSTARRGPVQETDTATAASCAVLNRAVLCRAMSRHCMSLLWRRRHQAA